MKVLKILALASVIVFLIIAGFFVKTYISAGELKDLHWHGSDSCRSVAGGLMGSEDIAIDPVSGMAFITSVDFRRFKGREHGPRGDVFGYDLTAENSKPVNLTADFKGALYPHGLGLYRGPEGLSVFVVNHRPPDEASDRSDDPSVEIFDYRGGKLVHRRTVAGPLLKSPNDVAPVGPDRFYATNDHGWTGDIGRIVEDYLQLSLADVVYFDGGEFQVVAEGFGYANGINVSPDSRWVYVGETSGRKLDVFQREASSGRLTPFKEIDMDTGVDNIDVDAEGNLWIGAHPKLLTFVRYADDPKRIAPCQIIKVEAGPDHGFKVEEVYLKDGRDLSGSSVGVFYQGKLFIGSVFDDKFLICDL